MDIKNLVLSDEAVNIIDNGTWVDNLPGAEGVSLFVTGMESEAAKAAMISAQADARMKNNGEPLTALQHSDATRKVLAEVVLKDWKGVTDNGKEIAYDKQLAKKWITIRNGERFAGLVLIAAQRVDAMAGEFAEKVAKN